MTAEFECCECGRHIIAIAADRPPMPPLCATCQFLPGWFREPDLRQVLDRDHDGHDRSALPYDPDWTP